jgi:hypothetical protein
MSLIHPPKRLLRDEALLWADAELATQPHAVLSLGAAAAACGARAPSLHKAFGSHAGFLATLAALQWERATKAVRAAGPTPLERALADIEFAIDNPHRFRLMYEGQLWSMVTDPAYEGPTREREGLEAMERYRDENFEVLQETISDDPNDPKVRLVAALLTGLSFEFVNERLFRGDREMQLKHAEELLGRVLG